jgi:hypothetical protein
MERSFEIIKLQVGNTKTGKVHRISLPIKWQREMEKTLDKTFDQGDLWCIELLGDGKGYKLTPLHS